MKRFLRIYDLIKALSITKVHIDKDKKEVKIIVENSSYSTWKLIKNNLKKHFNVAIGKFCRNENMWINWNYFVFEIDGILRKLDIWIYRDN